MNRCFWLSFVSALALASTSLATTSCKKSTLSEHAEALKAVAVRDGSQGLLFTWVDENGKFGTEQSVKEVPDKYREIVRVRDPGQEEDGEHITLADLRSAGADGSYPTRVAPRGEFDNLVKTRRAKNGKTLEATTAPSGSSVAAANAAGGAQAAAQTTVIIYGASWCGACHQAAAWMKNKGIAFVEKDIEADSSADREMRSKLAKVGRRGGSIPVIDVKGTIFVGFSAPDIERALRS